METPPYNPPKSPEKPRATDQINIIRTPNKLPNPRPTLKTPRHSPLLPDKYESLVRLFDALDSSLTLLRLRKSPPVFTTIRPMVENLSDRRFTHQHLAQLKFLLPEEIGVKKVLFPDEESRCMMHDLHLTLNKNSVTNAKKRKRRSKFSHLRELLTSRLVQFLRAHPERTEIPDAELPEPFNQRKQDHLLNTINKPSSVTCEKKVSVGALDTLPTHASHLPLSFKKQFSKGGFGNRTGNALRSSSVQPFHSPSTSKVPAEKLEPVPLMSGTERSEQPTTYMKQKHSAEGDTCYPQVVQTQSTPVKSDGTPIKPATPALQIPKMCNFSPGSKIVSSACNAANRPSCARSLMFENHSSTINIELHVDEAECSDILDILPEYVLESLKKKEEKLTAKAKRKQMVAQLPKLFDRIHFLFQGPRYSAIRKEVLIRDLTERHSDITDESEVEVQFNILQEILPEWIVRRFSPSGDILYSIDKAMEAASLRQRLDQAV